MENLITEGRYDQVTTELSREIVNAVKRGVKRYQTQIILFSHTKVDVSVYFHYNDEEPVEVSAGTYIDPKGIRPHYKNKRIVFHINIPKTESLRQQKMSELVPEVKNIIRHEIEHIAQAKFTDRARKGFFSSKRGYYGEEEAAKGKGITYLQYLLEPYEVEAYVRGLYKKGKTLKQPLNVLLDDWQEYLADTTHLSDQEIDQVMTAWRSYAKKHLPQTPQRWYGYIESPTNVNEDIGFKPSYMKPEINVIINFNFPDADKDLRPILEEVLERKNIKVNSMSIGSKGSCRLDLSFFNKRDVQHLIDDLHRELMVVHNVRIQDVTHYIK